MEATQTNAPLAERMRPDSLEQFFGQEQLLGPKSFLRAAVAEDRVPSMILWGPPGSGKTTLAHIIALSTNAEFVKLSATGSGVKDLRLILHRAEEGSRLGQKTVLFIDEIHRWNKSQQDTLLPHVERGTVTLIGATTENPSFEVNAALVSRSRVFVLERLTQESIRLILDQAINDELRGLGSRKLVIADDVRDFIALQANGDARMALNTLDACSGQQQEITVELVREVLQKSHLLYDKSGEEHYNIISALHKSMRGGDADASVYWLVRMLEGGEDPRYVARRIMRFASEDIGLANNTALIIANAAFDACHKLGMPECGVHLAHAVIYMAKAQKSVTAYRAYEHAKADVAKYGNLPVPLHLRNAPTKLMEQLDYGKGYKYTPLEDSSSQEYLPDELRGTRYVE
ncbi:MAG: replication-associated recombination protein A [Candidatus Uhrbacteria bacterium]